MAANHITKQLVQETLMDEGLRVVKQLADQIKDDGSGVDLRVFNKIAQESTRANFNVAPVSSLSIYKTETPRPRGRPPKMLDYGGVAHSQIYQNYQNYQNQGLNQSHSSSSQISHHLLTNLVSSHIQHSLSQSTLAFNPNGFNACSASNSSLTDDEPNEAIESSNGHSFSQIDAQKTLSISATDLSKHNNSSLVNGNKDSTLSGSPNSETALMAINGNAIKSESYKQDVNCSAV